MLCRKFERIPLKLDFIQILKLAQKFDLNPGTI